MAGNMFARSRPDPVARFNSSEVSESEIRAQLQSAEKIQSAQRARHSRSFWHPKPSRATRTNLDLELPAQLDRSGQDLPDSVSTLRNVDPSTLDRTSSFDSFSTSRCVEEAARQAQYRDSPVSACHTDRIPLEQTIDIDEPSSRLQAYALKQAKHVEKEGKRPFRKHKTLYTSNETAADLRKTDLLRLGSRKRMSSPRRAISDPSSRPREFANQLMKRLKGSQSAKLTRRPRSSPTAVPHIDDFDSKAHLQEYLQSALPETVIVDQPPAAIAELPGSIPLPAYTPYQSTPIISGTHAAGIGPGTSRAPNLQRAASLPSTPCCSSPPKMMRCDNCQFGIKHEDLYLQCLVCNHGDRIICDACDSSGYSCRHQLIRKRRNFLQEVDGVYNDHTIPRSASGARGVHDNATIHRSRTFTLPVDGIEANPSNTFQEDLPDAHFDVRELRLQQREQQLISREREVALSEREGRLRLKEAEVAVKEKKAECQHNSEFMRSCLELAVSLGAQFASISRSSSNASTPTSSISPRTQSSADPYFAGSSFDAGGMHSSTAPGRQFNSDPDTPSPDPVDLNLEAEGSRTHGAAKRKADKRSQSSTSRSNDTCQQGDGSALRDTSKPRVRYDDDGDDGDLMPKKPKRQVDAATAEGKLYACHYCKFDPARYSDCNNTEKHYRGCSSGYWTDISRLKQHLYRVHWQGYRRCTNCWTSFKSDDDFAAHQRATDCACLACPFPEKFNSDVYTELHKKRPKVSAEEVWYIIWDKLFPGVVRPPSPYTHHVSASPVLASEQNRQTLAHLFEARLSQHLPDRPGMSAEVRSFVLEQLWASMADLNAQHVLTDRARDDSVTPATTNGQMTRPTQPPRLTIPQQNVPFVETSSQPPSTISSTSTSSSRWHHLPAHRRSFSRPLNPTPTQPLVVQHEIVPPTTSTLTSAICTAPSDCFFRVPKPDNAEDDNWGEDANSWNQGDEAGLAVATDFNFQFIDFIQGHETPPAVSIAQEPRKKPMVNLQTLDGSEAMMYRNGIPITSQLQAKLPSEASNVDSAYGSAKSTRPIALPTTDKGSLEQRPVQREQENAMIYNVFDEYQGFLGQDEPMPESQIRWDALSVSIPDVMESSSWNGCAGG